MQTGDGQQAGQPGIGLLDLADQLQQGIDGEVGPLDGENQDAGLLLGRRRSSINS
ncbi:hypothetical protein XM38_001390 [Halomicronema hongdechloris C2206]|uniref:Uncharacterized protein n=1 Tax=Halomicronema hongdechloris C2206 TaxID=1641165 RepID=A0A1Z3HFZ3_9CYAN|nr:hypothetical protein XM38_001390 [Halomicronema hongdechloris C2206]